MDCKRFENSHRLELSSHFPVKPSEFERTLQYIAGLKSGQIARNVINVPWHERASNRDYELAFERLICPALRSFAPDLIIVSAGFDCAQGKAKIATVLTRSGDPLGEQGVTAPGFGSMTQSLLEVQSKVLLVLEGGYEYENLEDGPAACTLALLQEDANALKLEEIFDAKMNLNEHEAFSLSRLMSFNSVMNAHRMVIKSDYFPIEFEGLLRCFLC